MATVTPNNSNVTAAATTTSDIGGWVWKDSNNNGIQDPGELGVAGVSIKLNNTYTSDSLLAITDATGHYLFSNLTIDYYYYYYLALDKSTLPAGYQLAAQAQGTDPTLQSDFSTWDGVASTYITSGQSDLGVDAGIWDKKGSIGNKVWLDTDPLHPGLGSDSSPGVAGIKVTLYQAGIDGQFATADDVVLATQITDANGNYKFDNLMDGLYQVGFDIGSNYAFTQPNAGSLVNSSVDPLSSRSYAFYLDSAVDQTNIDAGLRTAAASISGLEWNDLNGDGYQLENMNTDQPLPTLANMTVKLYQAGTDNVFGTADDKLIDTQITDANGKYVFGNLPTGQYQVEFSLPNNNSIFTSSDGNGYYTGYVGDPGKIYVYGGPSAIVNSDIVANTHRSATIDVVAFKDVTNIDAGVTSNDTAIGDRVWEDTNADGAQETGEPGIAGVTVELLDPTGNVISTTTTDQNGQYLFSHLTAGDYSVHVVAPAGYIFTQQDTYTYYGNSSVDSTGHSSLSTLITNQKILYKDAGLVKPATIGDLVWNDTNHNGIQDNGEAGLAGITVQLFSPYTGIQPQTTTTDSNGKFTFTAAPGAYFINVDLPVDYAFSPFNQGQNDQLDSNLYIWTQTNYFNVASGENNTGIDIGMYSIPSIEGRVWNDTNGDGLQNTGEQDANAVLVQLLDSSGTVINQQNTYTYGGYKFNNVSYTDSSGLYHYENLAAGNYQIRVVAPQDAYVFSQKNVVDTSPNQLKNSTVDALGYSTVLTLSDGEHKQNIDAGIQSNLSIGDKAWNDLNRNGIQDAGEPGLAGVDIVLNIYDAKVGNYVQQQTVKTDTNGHYQFDHVPANFFYIQAALVDGYAYSPAYQGSDSSLDSNAENGIAYGDPSNQYNPLAYDIGMYIPPAITIGDRVWEDANCNGVQDEGEWNNGIAGVTVTLLNAAGTVVDSQVTDAKGNYLFELSTPGSYKIHVDTPTGYVFTGQDQAPMYGYSDNSAVDSQGNTALFNVTTGDHLTTKDAGVYKKATIGDFVWNDVNVNGIQDSGETGIAGVTVNLLNASDANNFIKSVQTDANGHYSFDNIDLGNYTVQVVAPSGYDYTYPKAGTDSALTSDVNILGYSDPINNWVSGVNAKVDAGLFQSTGKGSIGDRVWDDANCNGLQDGGEWNKGIAGVTVELLNTSGTVVATTQTDNSGQYMFKNIDAGDYKVHVIAPADFVSTLANQPNGTSGNSVIDANGYSSTISLAAGENLTNVDAGMYHKASFGNYVWNDLNQNGLQDQGEPGMVSVPVQLFGWINNQAFSQWAVTDITGHYQFDHVDLGNYTIQVEAPTGYTYTQPFVGTDTNIDSSVGLNGLTQDIHVWISGINDMSLDAGLYQIPAAATVASAALPDLASVLSTDTSIDSLLATSPVVSPTVTGDPLSINSTVDVSTLNLINHLDNYANQVAALA